MRACLPLISLVLVIACAVVPGRPSPLSEEAPEVIDLAPEADQPISTRPRIALLFSRLIDEASVGLRSVLLTQGEVDLTAYENVGDLFKAIDKGTLAGVPLNFAIGEGGFVLVISVEEDLQPQETYTLLVTPRVLSVDRIPLNQDSGGSETPFVAVYTTGDDGFAEELGDILGGESPVPPPVQGTVVLNEIYYDAVGSDTDGLLFAELYGTPGMGIGRFKVNFVNGSDGSVYDSITLPEEAVIGEDGFYLIADSRTGAPDITQVPGADLIDNFDPQNGPDAVQLLDPDGQLVDAVGYGEGLPAAAENGLAVFEGSAAPDVVNGHSLERREPGLDTNDNARDFVDRETPTPGG